jgi:hypothetical protein
VSWYRERAVKLGKDYDPHDRKAALNKVMEESGTFSIGVLYEGPSVSLFADRFRRNVTGQPLMELGMQKPEKIEELLSGFRRLA